ncbi:ATP-binding protein [Actinocorallia sp. B10E7]|uniref:ATP-binding protein n=1 Tax=Actinocorallia sp. B10E7 TaxID=3153558 RepID=UPI00325E0B45
MSHRTDKNSRRNVETELAYLTRMLKAPFLVAAVERLAERARAESWTHEEFLAACLQREVIAHLGTLDFVAAGDNVAFLGPPGTGKTHLSIGLGVRTCQVWHRVAFATAAQWVDRLAAAHAAGRLQDELVKLSRIPVLIMDEVGDILFGPEAANLFFDKLGRPADAQHTQTITGHSSRWKNALVRAGF